MGKLVVIEGVDGAGKRTLTDGLVAAITAQGATVARMAFPRYGSDIHADLVRDALYGRLGDLTDSVYGMALLFALDRRDAAEELRARRAEHDVVLVDRYIASNAAYGAARLHQDETGEFVAWVRALEVDRFGTVVPDLQLLLRVPVPVAAARAAGRAATDAARPPDTYESDSGLQARCAEVYEGLAARHWLSPWAVFDGAAEHPPEHPEHPPADRPSGTPEGVSDGTGDPTSDHIVGSAPSCAGGDATAPSGPPGYRSPAALVAQLLGG